MATWKELQEVLEENVDVDLTDAREALKRASEAKTRKAFWEAVQQAKDAFKVAIETLNDLDDDE